MTRLNPASTYVTDAEVQSVLAASRVLAAVAARSVAADQRIDPGDLRTLLIIADHANPLSVDDLAMATEASSVVVGRTVERLTATGLISCGGEDANLGRLALTADGRRVVAEALERRRHALEMIAYQLPALRRLELLGLFGDRDTPS